MLVQCCYIKTQDKGGSTIARDKYLTIRISEKMLSDFQKALDKTEHSKSEVVRECVRKFIAENK